MCGRIAALLIRMSTRPNSDSALAARASTSAFLPTSASTGTALTPRSRASCATASASCRFERALTTTCAPSRASFSTVARPILRPDPVTSATFPSSLPMLLSLLQCLHRSPHLGSDVESIFACAKAVEHVVAGCIARKDRRAFLPIPEIDFDRIEQRGLPVRAQRVGNLSMFQPEDIILRSGTDRRDRGGAVLCQLVGR